MRAFILFVGLLNAASNSVGQGLGGASNSGGLGGASSSNGINVGPGRRDASTPVRVDMNVVSNEIKTWLGKDLIDITANELRERANTIKNGAQVQLDESNEIISEEDVRNVLNAMSSKINLASLMDAPNSAVLVHGNYQVTVALNLLKNCAEEIERRQKSGEKYGVYLKVVIRLCDKINLITAGVEGIYVIDLLERHFRETNPEPAEVPKNRVGVAVVHVPQGGTDVKAEIEHRFDHVTVGTSVELNHGRDPVYGIWGSWTFK